MIAKIRFILSKDFFDDFLFIIKKLSFFTTTDILLKIFYQISNGIRLSDSFLSIHIKLQSFSNKVKNPNFINTLIFTNNLLYKEQCQCVCLCVSPSPGVGNRVGQRPPEQMRVRYDRASRSKRVGSREGQQSPFQPAGPVGAVSRQQGWA